MTGNENGSLSQLTTKLVKLSEGKKPEPPHQEKHPNLRKGNPGKQGQGRPTKYEDWMVAEVSAYCKKVFEGKTFIKEHFPTLEGYALHIGVDADTVTNWEQAKDEKGNLLHPEFFGAIKRMKNLQKQVIINDGMYNKDANATMAIFLLKNNHDMRDKVDTDVTSKGESIKQVVGFNFLPPAEANGNHTSNSNNKANS